MRSCPSTLSSQPATPAGACMAVPGTHCPRASQHGHWHCRTSVRGKGCSLHPVLHEFISAGFAGQRKSRCHLHWWDMSLGPSGSKCASAAPDESASTSSVHVPAAPGQACLSHKIAACTPITTTLNQDQSESATLIFTAIVKVTSWYLLSQQQDKSWRAGG